MRRRRFIVGIGVLLAVLGSVLAFLLRPREPAYQGRPLSQWLEDLDSRQPLVKAQATEALRQMGTNTLFWLVRMIEKRDSGLKRRVMVAMSERNLPGAQYLKTASYGQYKACRAFRVLGRSAEPAVPALVAVLSNGPACLEIAATLPWLGPQGVRGLTNAMAHAERQQFGAIYMALSCYSRDFQSGAMPGQDQDLVFQACARAVISRLADPDFLVRDLALSSLEHLPVQPEVVVPVLTSNLAREDLLPHASELKALGRFGPAAKAAVPALVNYAHEAKISQERDQAIKALEKIDPEAAAQAQGK
jgi:hypothetical protein